MLLEVTLMQNLQGQEIINRWNYEGTGTPEGVNMSQALLSAMGAEWTPGTPGSFPAGTIFDLLRPIQTADCQFVQVVARNIVPGADFFEIPFPTNVLGTTTGACVSPFVAFGFNTNRKTTAIRRGQKRFAGVSESAIGVGGVIESATMTALEALAVEMSAVLHYTAGGNSLTFAPRIVQKEKVVGTDGKVKYRYFADEAVQLEHSYSGFVWSPKTQVRSQTSRQYGHGA